MAAIQEVIKWTMTLFKNYYIPRELPPHPSPFPTQVYLKICEKNLYRGINVGHFSLNEQDSGELCDTALR
jgi:hypothetical protein